MLRLDRLSLGSMIMFLVLDILMRGTLEASKQLLRWCWICFSIRGEVWAFTINTCGEGIAYFLRGWDCHKIDSATC